MHNQSFQHRRRQPCQPDDAADAEVGETLFGGEIGERGDLAAFVQLPLTPSKTDGAQDVWILPAIHFNLDLFGRQEVRDLMRDDVNLLHTSHLGADDPGLYAGAESWMTVAVTRDEPEPDRQMLRRMD